MVTSIIRTVVPYLIGWVATVLLTLGIDMPEAVQDWATEALVVIIGTAYYVAARWLEARGVRIPLLGSTAVPAYTDQGRVDAEVTAYRSSSKRDATYHDGTDG